eukprot:UN02361
MLFFGIFSHIHRKQNGDPCKLNYPANDDFNIPAMNESMEKSGSMSEFSASNVNTLQQKVSVTSKLV